MRKRKIEFQEEQNRNKIAEAESHPCKILNLKKPVFLIETWEKHLCQILQAKDTRQHCTGEEKTL